MKTYSLLKLNRLIKNHRIKFLGLYLLHKLNKRYLAVYFDPVNACNLRCKMCYFTDSDYVKKLRGTFDKKDLPLLGKAVLRRALKLQIGCGTEPTLYKDIDKIIEIANQYKVPHISLTTNANLLKQEKLQQWVDLGLNEIIISLHGVHQKTYENFMQKGDYKKFHSALQWITKLKKNNNNLSLRINYTFNEDNFKELSDFFNIYGKYKIDTLQLRPINNLGNTSYQNFKMDKIIPIYDKMVHEIQSSCNSKNTTLIATPKATSLISRKNKESLIFNYTYCYISPLDFWHKDFDWKNETYNDFATRKKIPNEFLKNVFTSSKKLNYLQKDNLNYKIN